MALLLLSIREGGRAVSWAIQEAIASVCLSHPDDCRCRVCLAYHGDLDSYIAIVSAVSLRLPLEKLEGK